MTEKKKREFVAVAGRQSDVVTKLAQSVYALGGSDEDILRLVSDDTLRGQIAKQLVDYAVVDLSADPLVPDGYVVVSHEKDGAIDLAKAKIELYLAEWQKKGSIRGEALRRDLANKPTLNANALDFYMKNQHLIPEDWKGRCVCFWGTIYGREPGHLYVRYLCWRGNWWLWDVSSIGENWGSNGPAAVVASRT